MNSSQIIFLGLVPMFLLFAYIVRDKPVHVTATGGTSATFEAPKLNVRQGDEHHDAFVFNETPSQRYLRAKANWTKLYSEAFNEKTELRKQADRAFSEMMAAEEAMKKEGSAAQNSGDAK